MKIVYLDTSALVALALSERGSKRVVAKLESAQSVHSSNLLEAEFRAALARERVEDTALLQRIDWVIPDRPLSPEIKRVLEAGYLRGADLWHVACALFLDPHARELEFVTLDKQQGAVARKLEFQTP
jgi:predicted nucleic acid-binding protein